MTNIFKTLSAAALLAFSAGTLVAQETTTEETSTTADLSLGEPTLQPGQPYAREQFGDWTIRCLNNPEGDDPCQLYQLLTDANGNEVAEINLFPLDGAGEAAAGANIVAPLGTFLTQGVTLQVDGGEARRYPFTFCNAGGCVARVGFTAAEIAQFKAGNAVQMTLVPFAAPENRVELTISLTGFTAAFDSGTPAPAQ
ncbi:invasion associated locus B family protein [Loktanella sp. IMCC34160]|uniref:invasion associated locus B family protein n=1 Tax=Loktanella sp. IMCC34160 TaxID=2510646 RepID=UPI00101CD2AA|nr:invasion associated locus B family protein [Loktanella sp. IMCC34160]RYG92374.1 invasion associated locus B family protein [Loktanella sp. IMCC34160]